MGKERIALEILVSGNFLRSQKRKAPNITNMPPPMSGVNLSSNGSIKYVYFQSSRATRRSFPKDPRVNKQTPYYYPVRDIPR
jgi:hypothetical protein